MGKHRATDKAIRNIMHWAARPEWSDEQTIVFNAHLNPLCDRIGISQEELATKLPNAWTPAPNGNATPQTSIPGYGYRSQKPMATKRNAA